MIRGELCWADFGMPFTNNKSKLKKDSVITISQIDVIDRQRLIEKIENNIMLVLGMGNI